MISPCRIHRTCRRANPLFIALLFATCLLIPVTEAVGQYGGGSSSGSSGGSSGKSVAFGITTGLDFGYDDNVIGANLGTSSRGSPSFFVKENLVLSYDRARETTEVRLLAVGRFSQYLDLGANDKDTNVTFALTHQFSTRLTFTADLYAAYNTEPNFQSNVGPENVRSPYIETNDVFSLSYHWLPRVSTVTSYTFERIKYVQSTAVGLSQDRFEHTFAESLRLSLTKRTILIGEYRYLIVDYDTSPRDSTTHFTLAGIDHHLTEHLTISVLGGPSFRSFKDDGDQMNPYAEVKAAYTGSRHSINWTTSYGVEQPTGAITQGNTTLRTGLNVNYDLTSRLNARAAAYFHHSDNQGQSGTSSGGGQAQDALQLTLTFKYTINKHFSLHLDYEYSSQSSGQGQSGYSRNRYFGGVSYTY